jgi:hypothetical protein
MKKTRLHIEHNYDFELFGITSSTKFFKLAWAINTELNIRLIKQEDFVLEFSNGENINFVNYLFEDDSCIFQVYKNKSPDNEAKFIIPELSHYDYVVKINGSFQSFALEEVLKVLRNVKYIEYIARIAIDKLKSKDNFLN